MLSPVQKPTLDILFYSILVPSPMLVAMQDFPHFLQGWVTQERSQCPRWAKNIENSIILYSCGICMCDGLTFQWRILRTCSRLVLSASGSALTLHATSSCAVEDATCFALEISFSSEAIPCTSELADSTRLCVAAATRRAAEMRPSDHWPSSELVRGRRLTCAQVNNSG